MCERSSSVYLGTPKDVLDRTPFRIHAWPTIHPSAYQWSDSAWRGRPWSDAVLYELHVGTFTEEGTFLAAIEKLDHLVQLGVTAIKIMPVANFRGKRNWGYDGVLLYAPDSSYGRLEDFTAVVDAAHLRDLMVILDVVYNHFGPDGNFLPSYAPQIFTDHHKTPWGDAVNYDSEGGTVCSSAAGRVHRLYAEPRPDRESSLWGSA
jgi:maltooligosyltrehalose trehalohydrolase